MKQNKIIDQSGNTSVQEQLLLECNAMAKYALSSGTGVPANIIQILEDFSREKPVEETQPAGEETDISRDLRPLIKVHGQLVKIVEPAKPKTILLMEQEALKPGFLKFLGVVPFVRLMMLAAIICLVLFIAISLSPDINNEPDSWSLFKSSGWALLLKELFLLSAAGMGASFAALFRANRYIVDGTFDPKYESSYWVRFSLGFIAGMMLATLIPIEESVQADFGKPLLAMLGGFSADLVYRIISRVIETLEALFRGDTRTIEQAQREQVKAKAIGEDMENRFKVASNIMKIQQQIDNGMTPEEIKKKMGKIMDDMVNTDSLDETGA